MSMQTNLNIRTDATIKREAEQIFNKLGLNLSTAVNIFLRQAILQKGLPFEVKLDVPNETTEAAIKEGRLIATSPDVRGYKNMQDLKDALDV